MAARASITAVLLAVLLGYVYNSYVQRALVVMGAFRQAGSTELAPGDFVVIDGTTHCEDLHYHESTSLIFTACEGFQGARLKWFPPIDHFFEPSHPELVKGNLQIIDPKVRTIRKPLFILQDGTFLTFQRRHSRRRFWNWKALAVHS